MRQEPQDDVRITDYVMDEMEEQQRLEFEAAMADSPDLQRRVRELRETVSLLQEGIAAEQPVELGEFPCETVQSSPAVRRRKLVRALWFTAASVAVLGAIYLFKPTIHPAMDRSGVARLTVEENTRDLQKSVDKPLEQLSYDDSWEPQGGTGTMEGFSTTLSLEVAQTQEVLPPSPHPEEIASGFVEESTDEGKPSSGDGEPVPHSAWQSLAEKRTGYQSIDLMRRSDPRLGFRANNVTGERYESDQSQLESRLSVLPGEGSGPGLRGDQYDSITENEFLHVTDTPLSTFSIDTDTASYSKIRSYLRDFHQMPQPGMVRIEELINYFSYNYAGPDDVRPFAAHLAAASCPWNAEHRLVRVALKGREIDPAKRPASNLVFLLDVSGSMDQPNKFPLMVQALKLLTQQLTENDRVAIIVYAGAAGLVLDSTTGDRPQEIEAALDRLRAGGSTNGGEGITLAYQHALDHFIKGGTNRVILCTDGDFNVGTTSTDALVTLVAEQAKAGVVLTVLGFGTGNLNDSLLEQISNRGNGNYAFVDTLQEARKVLVEQIASTMVVLAKDVKIQVEFNPNRVASYRLLGYENRVMAARDFNDDKKDAGEIGPGHTVTALYEIVPVTAEGKNPSAAESALDPLKYQSPSEPTDAALSDELLTLKLRYKEPEADQSQLLSFTLTDTGASFAESDRDLQFAAAVAAFGMVLRDSKFKGNATLPAVLELTQAAYDASDPGSEYRQELIELVRQAMTISGQ